MQLGAKAQGNGRSRATEDTEAVGVPFWSVGYSEQKVRAVHGGGFPTAFLLPPS